MILNMHRNMHSYANLVQQGVKLRGLEETENAGKGTSARRVRGRTLGLVGLGKLKPSVYMFCV